METNIKIFENPTFGSVRTISDENGEPLFCLADVCKAVELTNTTAVKKRLDAEDVQLVDLHALNSNNEQIVGNSMANFITESGFYDVLLESSSPKVKPFRRWITHDVLPSIRRHGGYLVTKQGESDDELIARAMGLLHKKLEESKQFIARQELEIEKHQELMKSIAPKADYYDQVLTAESTYTTTQIAKEFGMSGKRLNEVLHAMGVQYKVNEQWVLYADYCGKGYTKTLTFTYSDADGQLHSRQSTAWTEKGREFIHKLMRENQK